MLSRPIESVTASLGGEDEFALRSWPRVSRSGTLLIVMSLSWWISFDRRFRHQVHRPPGWQERQSVQAHPHDDLGDGLLDLAFQLVYGLVVHLARSLRHEPRISPDGLQALIHGECV